MNKTTLNRRQFLQLGCAGLASTTMMSSLVNLGGITSASAQTNPSDYRALVCVLLAGGIDSYNLLVPTANQAYQDYRAIRSDLALQQASLLPLSGNSADGNTFAVHTGASELQSLYNTGNLAFVANLGTLAEKTTADQVNSGFAHLPFGLYSHADQINQWQTSLPDQQSATGWGGRLADALASVNSNQTISMNISLGGSNVFQSGNKAVEYSIEPGVGSIGIQGYGEDGLLNQLSTTAVDSMLAQQYQSIFERTYTKKLTQAIDNNMQFSAALANNTPLQTSFSANPVSSSFATIAQTIAARNTLGMQRQTFFIVFGGWDHHDEVLNNMNTMLPIVSKGMAEFYTALTELGVQNNVTTFTISDFARTLTSNGRGSDHAWGGNMMVMGGAVKGGQVYGQYPSLYAGNPLDTGRGRLVPTSSVDEYFAELALWLGASRTDLDLILPNISRFYDPYSNTAPIGFMSA